MSNLKVSEMNEITELPNGSIFYVVLPDGSFGKVSKETLESIFSSGGTNGSQDLLQTLENGSIATIEKISNSDVKYIVEMPKTDIENDVFYKREQINTPNANVLVQISDDGSYSNSVDKTIALPNNASKQITKNQFNTIIGDGNFEEGTYQINEIISVNDSTETQNIQSYYSVAVPLPKTNTDVVIEMPYKETSGTYRVATLDDIVSGNVNSVNGQTGNVVLDKHDVDLGNVDNTADIEKPISNATQNALNLKINNAIIYCSHNAQNLADNTSYFFGIPVGYTATTSTNTARGFEAPFTGSISDVYATCLSVTATSAEDVILRIKNVTQNTQIDVGNVRFNNVTPKFIFNNLNFSVNKNDRLECILIVPVLATNGTLSRADVNIIFQRS